MKSIICGLLSIVASSLFVAGVAGATGSPFERHGPPELGPLVSGTTSIVHGTHVWTDYAYDDRGPNTIETSVIGPRGAAPGSAARSGGDAVYESWAAPGNAADLIQLQIARRPWGLQVRAILETLVDPNLPILGLALDTDADPTTGAANLPGGRWPSPDPMGIEFVVVITNAGADLYAFSEADGDWHHRRRFPTRVDPERNVLDANLFRGGMPPMRGIWGAFGVLGVMNPETGGSWHDGGEPIFDLAFVGDEAQVKWQDMKQSDILAGHLPAALAAAELNFEKMRPWVHEPTDELAPGFKTFLHHSRLDLPEGVTLPAPDVSLGQHEYLGPYQPYQVFVPDTLLPGNPLLVSLHGANTNHLVSIFTVPNGDYVGTSREFTEDPFLISMFVPDFGQNAKTADTLKVWPLGRGETLSYRGIGEIDVLEVVDDVIERLGVDPDRITLQGDSMGGFGAYRLGTRYPDRWAAVIPVIGGGAADRHLFENLSNVPIRQINGQLDPLVSYEAALEDQARLDALELEHVFYGLLDRGHDPSANSQCVRDQAADFVRDTNPARIVYRIDPATFQHDPTRDLDVVYDEAYWLSELILADADQMGEIRAASDARPHSDETIVRDDAVLGNTEEARDLCGPNPDFAPGWSSAFPNGESWLEVSLDRVQGPPEPLANVLRLDLSNLAAATVDLERAGFDLGTRGVLEVTSDVPVTLGLNGLRPRAQILIDGERPRHSVRRGDVAVELPAGSSHLEIRGCRSGWSKGWNSGWRGRGC